MKHCRFHRLISMLLAVTMLFSLLALPANAASLTGSGSVTIKYLGRKEYLKKSTGGSLSGSSWSYTSNDGLTGTAYCVNWGLAAVSSSKSLTIQEYNRKPQTMGVFANGYPNRTLAQFKELHQDDVRGIANLTEDEYKYATQVAIWASCGQLSVPGTSFTAGRAALVEPTADAQQIRVFDTIKAMLQLAQGWTKHLYTGMYLRAEENKDVRGVEVISDLGLESAAADGLEGIKKETINGKEYYTRVMYVASATSTWIDDYTTKVYSTDAPSGTIFVAENNSPLETVQENGATYYKVNTSKSRNTNLNANGSEYYGAFKVCIPVDNVADEGSFTIKATGGVAQFNLFLAYNPAATEQSYIISDPGYTTCNAQATFKWSSTDDTFDTASLQVVKAGAGGAPLEGAEFTLTGSGGTVVTGTSDRNGQVAWTDLPADETYTLTETSAPDGYQIIAPMNITLTAGRTAYVTVTDETEKGFTIKKVDAQNKGSLQGAVFLFEQIDGSYKTTGITGFDGIISFEGDALPYGSYRITEQSPPQGYVKSSRVETVQWDGTKDVTITWENVRDIGITIVKVDEQTGISLPNATFDVYADGELITSVTTNDAGEAYVSGIKKEAYIEVVETAAPAGYVLDQTPHGIHVDPYNPTIEDDPVLTVTNRARPALRILKYDLTSKAPMPDVTFEVWHDGELFGEYTTNSSGEIFLYDLEPGTYLVKEIATDDAHVVNSTPQQIELNAGDTQTRELVFFNSLKPGIHLVKVDSVTMKSLPNVRFEFKLVGGSYRQEFTTDINGEIDLSKLAPGAYEVRELEAPEGYLIDNAVRVVQINPDENANFVFTNTPKPALRLIKTSSDGTRLGGVHFRIAKIEDGSHYLDRITDNNGEINISNLEPGVYSVQETATVSDHILDLREFHVELFAGKTSTLTIENQKRPNLTIRKTDKDNGKPISGVTFTLRGADGPTITTEPTGADGTVRITNLLPGTYTVTEQSVPEHYILDTTPQTVTLFANREAQVEFQNYQRPTLKIAKVDINGRPLTGAIFTVTTKAEVKIGDFPVGADGTVTVSNVHLDEGYYIITEKQAPEGYILDATPHEVYLRPGKTTEISIENEKKPSLTIRKIDSVVGDGVQGAKFEIFVSKDKSQNGTYQKLNSSYYYTDANGLIELSNLDTGWYKIVEVEPAAGFTMKEPSEQVIYVEHDKAVEVVFENTPLNAIVVEKYDSVTGAALAGATFQLRYLGGTSGTGGTAIGQKTTSKNGTAIWTGLNPGTYILEEVDPADGYSIIQSSETIYLADSGEQSVVTVRFANAPDGILLIRKVCAVNPSVTLQNAEFKVMYADGTLIGDSNGIYRTDENGEIRITGLKPGKSVIVTETKAPDGFIIDTQSQAIQIQEGKTVTLTFKNQPKGSIIIQKRDSQTNKPLSGAQFRVTTAAGCEVGLDGVIGTSTLTSNGIFTTDSSGEIRISNLAPGAYVLTEVKAPAGYVMDAPSTNVIIGAGGDTQTVVITNTLKGGLVVTKYDSVTKQPLSGAQFKITTASGELVADNEGLTSSNGLYTTNAEGQIVLSKLLPGTYIVTETRAPDNYRADPTPQTVVVNAGDTQSLSFYDEPLCILTILKRDAVTHKPLKGAEFTVKDSDGRSIGRYVTGTDGTVTVSGLAPNATIVVSESKAPTGYLLDETPKNIVVRSGVANSLTFDDEPGTTLIIRKFIEGTENEPLSGVAFKVVDGSGAAVGPDDGVYYTDKAGEIVLDGIEPGTTVIAREIKTVDGFVLDGTPQDILIKAGEVQQLTFWNKRDCTLTILKQSTDKTPLTGAVFHVTDEDGAAIGTNNGHYTSDRNGLVTITGLQPGQVLIVTEEKAPDGYVRDMTPKTIKIKQGAANSLIFENAHAGSLVINKRSSVDKKTPLEGVTFKITTTSGEFLPDENGKISSNGLYYTDGNGQIVLNSVVGTLVVTEVATIDGYTISDANRTQTVEVKPDDTQTLYFYNDPLCSLTITKLDSVTGKPVPGTVFAVKDGSGNLLGSYTTGQDGTVTVTGLVPGSTVVVTETKVPAGYVLDPTPQTITVKNGTGNSVTTGSGSVGTTSGGNGLTFENDPTVNLTIHKYIEGTQNEPLAGVAFKIVDGSGAAVGPGDGVFYTNAAGEIVVEGLEPGTTITAREIKTVDGFVLDGTPKTVKITAGSQAPELTFWNARAGELVIRKLDSVTKQPLAGVEFELTYAGGGYVDTANGHLSSNGLYTTDAHGEIHISGVTGTIVVKETRTIPGYTIDESTRTQTVTVNSQDTQTLTFYNNPQQTLTIQKYVDGTTDPIQGVAFLVTDSTGAYVGPNNGEYVTDKNGRIVITDLTPGVTITAKEIRTASGYVLDTTPQSILIKQGAAQTLTFFNKAEGGLELIKVNEADRSQRIPGVTFEIRRMNGGLVDTVTTDKTGRVHVALDAGDYYAVEIEAAQGFKLDAAPNYFTVQDNKTTTLTVTNKAFSGILIHKTDSVTGKGIYGVTFLLYDSANTPIGQYTSDNSGYVYIENLTTSGRYYLRELANDGYIVDTQMKTVYVTAGQTTLVEWKNTPITGQIQITKKSADYNSTNGLPAGTLLEGAKFEIYDKANNLVDTIVSDNRGLAVSKQLPLGRYTVREVQAPANYGVSGQDLTAYLEYSGQILRFEVTNKSLTTGVSITKTGPSEIMAGQPVRYVFSDIANASNVALTSFYWRDTLPAEVRLDSIVTGTYNFPGTYKITYRVNGGEYRTLADNLSTQKNYTLAASSVALGLASNERVTEIMFVFGQAPAGFAQVEKPMLYCTAVKSISSTSFVNVADVGGVYNGVWVQAVTRWVTKVYGKPTTLPRTGY